MFKKLFIIFISIVWLSVLAIFPFQKNTVFAVTKTYGVLEISYPGSGPLFSIQNAAPGMNEPRTITVKNYGSIAHSLSIATQGTLGSLAPVTEIEVRHTSDNSLIWSKKLNEIAVIPSSTLILPSIRPNETKQIDIIAILPTSLGNEYQEKSSLVFDFIVGTEDEDNNTDGGMNSEINNNEDNNPVSEQTPATTSTSEISGNNIRSSLTSDNKPTSDIKLKNPKDKLFGIPINNDEVKGASARCFSNIWWWILLVILAVFLLIFGFIIRKEKKVVWRYLPAVLAGLLIYIIFLLLNRDCCTSFWWCKYFWLIDLVEVILYLVIMRLMKSNEKQEGNPEDKDFKNIKLPE